VADQEGNGAPQAGAQSQTNSGSGDPQAGANAQQRPQAGTNNTTPTTQEEKAYSETAYKKVQSEAKNLRDRLRKYEDPEKPPEQSEHAQLQSKYDEAVDELKTLRGQVRTAQVASAAGKAGAIYPDAVARLIPADAEDTEAALKEVRKQYPAMFRQGSADAGAATNGKPLTNDMNDILRSAARRG
jgi:hypothetical protein